jgi:hypothetical protein
LSEKPEQAGTDSIPAAKDLSLAGKGLFSPRKAFRPENFCGGAGKRLPGGGLDFPAGGEGFFGPEKVLSLGEKVLS